MTDTWNDILHVQRKQSSLRERLRKRKQEMQNIEAELKGQLTDFSSATSSTLDLIPPKKETLVADVKPPVLSNEPVEESKKKVIPEEQLSVEQVEAELLRILSDVGVSIELPVEVEKLISTRAKNLRSNRRQVNDLLQKFNVQSIVTLDESSKDSGSEFIITNVDNAKLLALQDTEGHNSMKKKIRKRDGDSKTATSGVAESDLENLLLAQTAKERETQRLNEEIMELLNKPTAKEKSLLEKFRSQGGSQVQEFCPFSTKEECSKMRPSNTPCRKLHFRKIIQPHTDESLGDCSFLNTCFHFQTCKYVHYEIDQSGGQAFSQSISSLSNAGRDGGGNASQQGLHKVPSSLSDNPGRTSLYPPQWVQCDVRTLNMRILGKFAILMADPPWDIHMELPYGTMSDDEMRQLDIPCLQDEGYMFLWVTGRAMELGRECLRLWGYERVDEIIWVKTNQLQRIIRTGRTGHWINHGKEHCLVGAKGDLKDVNKGLDCDVIVSEVRATSHKPDEIYGIIERLSPGTRKLELFGRPHNVQPNWITLGNQLDGVRLLDPEVVERYKSCYPKGYSISGSN